MKIKKHCLLLIMWLCALVFWHAAGASADDRFGRYEAGFMVGSGSGPIAEGTYEPVLFMGHFGYNFEIGPRKTDRSGIFSLFIEPQANPIFRPRTEYEAGLAFGAQYLYPLTDELRPYILAAAGPHYLSLESADESQGFLFQLTAGAGFYYFLDKKTALNIGWRFRHLSNAGLRHPNVGINMHAGVIGLSFFF